MWYGAGRGVRDLIAFSIGPCVSAGVISNGTLLAGRARCRQLRGVAGAEPRGAGRLSPAGLPGSRRRIRGHRAAAYLADQDPVIESRVLENVGGNYADIHLDDILKAARDGDGVSISVIRDTVRYLAMAVSNIAVVIDPEVIVLGGILQSAGDLLLDPIRQECARRMPPAMQAHAKIELSMLGPDAAPMGAARFAFTGTQLP